MYQRSFTLQTQNLFPTLKLWLMIPSFVYLNLRIEKMIKELINNADLSKCDLYTKSEKLPTIMIDDSNRETYLHYIQCAKMISDTFGKDLSILLADICKSLEIDPEKQVDDPYHKFIVKHFMNILTILSFSFTQSDELISFINNYKDQTVYVSGDRYCMVVFMLKQLAPSYFDIASILLSNSYLSEPKIHQINEVMVFLESTTMEELRKAFKVRECYESLENKITLH